MTGLAIKFGGTFTDEDLTIYKYDPLLSDGDGSLFLMDVRNWSAGVPAHGQALANIAREQAEATGIVGDTSGVFEKLGDLSSGGLGAIERSGKGGLAVICRQASDIPANNGFNVLVPNNIVAYLIANPSHNFYFSQWRRLTRTAITSEGGACALLSIEGASNVGNVRFTGISAQNLPSGANAIGNRADPGINVVGNTFQNRAGITHDTTPVLANYNTGRSVAVMGAVPKQNNQPATLNNLQSWIFYRAYIEDLTASGRSYAAVDALDYAMWQEAFGPGGRFNGDTFTAPSTIP